MNKSGEKAQNRNQRANRNLGYLMLCSIKYKYYKKKHNRDVFKLNKLLRLSVMRKKKQF